MYATEQETEVGEEEYEPDPEDAAVVEDIRERWGMNGYPVPATAPYAGIGEPASEPIRICACCAQELPRCDCRYVSACPVCGKCPNHCEGKSEHEQSGSTGYPDYLSTMPEHTDKHPGPMPPRTRRAIMKSGYLCESGCSGSLCDAEFCPCDCHKKRVPTMEDEMKERETEEPPYTDDNPIEAARCPSCGQTKCPECDGSRTSEHLRRAMDLLQRVEDASSQAPDPEWYRDYFLLTKRHMILTEDGWEDGENKRAYLDNLEGDDVSDVILAEVNAPTAEGLETDTPGPSVHCRGS